MKNLEFNKSVLHNENEYVMFIACYTKNSCREASFSLRNEKCLGSDSDEVFCPMLDILPHLCKLFYFTI